MTVFKTKQSNSKSKPATISSGFVTDVAIPKDDPLFFSTFISVALQDKSPLQQLLKDAWRKVEVFWTLPQNMAKAKDEIAYLENKLAKLEELAEAPIQPTTGTRLNRVR